ncbi:hypothetical protein [Ectopseudomonas mendocina]|uniref:Uncharacterized protein n=1 Tax=Ectopseudomonas mendocina TaxID=300 RepID=A0A2R3QWQ0_ECTME|nr:hypothetical protein [Pseudomonas mendocina]AVO56153.1 hypothetical protein C7A17_26560 [Pseudomonas mendocina]
MINLAELSDSELAAHISAAMAEFQRRLNTPKPVEHNAAAPAPEAPIAKPKRPVKTPAEADQRFVRACLRLLRSQGYIKAADKDRYREIVKKHPRWTKINGYPDTLRGSTANHWLDFNNPLDDK